MKNKSINSSKNSRDMNDPAPYESDEESIHSSLPKNIASVHRVVDEDNKFRGELLVVTRKSEGLEQRDLLQSSGFGVGKLDGLAQLCVWNDWLPVVDRKSLNALAHALHDEARDKSLFLLKGDGHHQVTVDSKKYAALVWRGVARWIGEPPDVKYEVLSPAKPFPEASGSCKGWNRRIGRHLAGNPKLAIAIYAALAAPLVALLDLPTTCLILVGASSTGKSTIQFAAQSLTHWTEAEQTASSTANSVRLFMLEARHRTAILHDLQEMKEVPQYTTLLFDLANNASRSTTAADRSYSNTAPLQCSFIGSSERSLFDLIRSARGAPTNGGLSARVFEVVINGKHGAFDTLPPGVDAASFAMQLERDAKTHYGSMWDEWVRIIAEKGVSIKTLYRERFDAMVDELLAVVGSKDPITRRLVLGVAVWVFAGGIAAKTGLLPLKTADVKNGVKQLLRAHAARHPSGLNASGDAVINLIKGFLDEHARDFPELRQDVDIGTQSTPYGYRFTRGKKTQYLFLTQAFDKHIADKVGRDLALTALRDADFLCFDKGSLQKQIRVGPGKKRFYVIKASIQYDRT